MSHFPLQALLDSVRAVAPDAEVVLMTAYYYDKDHVIKRSKLEGLDQVNEKELARVEAIILSMTPHERRVPHVIDGSRRKRIAAGSGTTVTQVNQLIEARRQMAKMMKMIGSGKMPQIAAPGSPRPRKSATKRRKKKARR